MVKNAKNNNNHRNDAHRLKGSEAKEAAKRKTRETRERKERRVEGGGGRRAKSKHEAATPRRRVVPENAKFVIERNTGREYMAAFRSGDGFY